MKGVYLFGYIESKEKKMLKSANFIKSAVLKICKAVKLKVVGTKYHIFKNTSGITYCFILSQSHFVVHTWPEENKIFFDIFTCNEDINGKKYIQLLAKELNGSPKEVKKVEYK